MGKSEPKAQKLLDYALESGWEGELEHGEGDTARVVLTRGEETLDLLWRDGSWGGAFDWSTVSYSLNGSTRRVQNASAAKKIIAGTPDYSRKTRTPGGRKGGTVKASDNGGVPTPRKQALPWDPHEADDADILQACYGKTLIWRNTFTGAEDREQVTPAYTDSKSGRYHKANYDKRIYHITTGSNGRRSLNFVSNHGFRSVGLDTLLVVK